MNNRRTTPLYLVMIATHMAHVFEEISFDFKAIGVVGGLSLFLALNWLLICLTLFLFYEVLSEKRWAYKLSVIYAAAMTINGLAHNVGMIVTGEYSGGFAGCLTGIVLIVLGPIMTYFLLREMPSN